MFSTSLKLEQLAAEVGLTTDLLPCFNNKKMQFTTERKGDKKGDEFYF